MHRRRRSRAGSPAGWLLGAALAASVAGQGPSPGKKTVHGLHARFVYNGVGQAITLQASAPEGWSSVDLVLMDAGGSVLAVPRSAPAEWFDLRVVMPAAIDVVAERREACYLQLVVDEHPTGSALVLQPMLDRLVPSTSVAPHPVTGRPHTRIDGWLVESALPPPGEGREESGPGPEAPAGADAPRVFTGLRIHPERDVRLVTTHGTMVIALRPDQAPNTAWSFARLVEGGFYRGVVFHRVVPRTRSGQPFVIQAGDPGRTGEGGPGYWMPIEPSGLEHDFGVISMARADPVDSAGSQFFICLSREGTARLDGQYCAFGYAVDGAETIRAIAEVELIDVARGRPASPPEILRAELIPAPPRAPGTGRPDSRVRPASEQARPPGRVPR